MNGLPADGPGLTWSELDDLADYTEGLLDGAPAQRIADLIRTDERWAAAHAALDAAEPAVRAALHVAAEVPPALPDAVAARLDAAVGQAARAVDSRPARRRRAASSGPPTRSAARTGAAGPGRSRRVVLSRVMAAVLVLGAIGGVTAVAREFLAAGRNPLSAADNAAPEVFGEADGAGAPQEAPVQTPAPAQAADVLAGAALFATGMDYRRETLPQLVHQPPAPALRASEALDAAISGAVKADGLDRCLAAVGLVHPGPVVAVDFARFEGEPAVILVVQQREQSIVVAVGPDCGSPGADILASVEVP